MNAEAFVFGLILLAAVLHATWNALLKISGDRLLTLCFLMGTGAVLFLPLLPFVAFPPASCWPYLGASVAVHAAYYFFLLRAYRHGDLSQAYPIARGTGPVVVVGLAGFVAGEPTTLTEVVGVLLISAGIVGIATNRAAFSGFDWRPVKFAIFTGLMIGSYSLIDGLGVRAAGAGPWGYIAWFHVLDAVPVLVVAPLLRRGQIRPFVRAHGVRSILGGVMATLAYTLVIWAMSLTRLAQVAALREVSVVFAALIGTLFLDEPFGRRRTACAATVAAGIVALHL